MGVLTDGKYQPTLIGGMGIYLAGETPARTVESGEQKRERTRGMGHKREQPSDPIGVLTNGK